MSSLLFGDSPNIQARQQADYLDPNHEIRASYERQIEKEKAIEKQLQQIREQAVEESKQARVDRINSYPDKFYGSIAERIRAIPVERHESTLEDLRRAVDAQRGKSPNQVHKCPGCGKDTDIRNSYCSRVCEDAVNYKKRRDPEKGAVSEETYTATMPKWDDVRNGRVMTKLEKAEQLKRASAKADMLSEQQINSFMKTDKSLKTFNQKIQDPIYHVGGSR
jgi:hypothetical protein